MAGSLGGGKEALVRVMELTKKVQCRKRCRTAGAGKGAGVATASVIFDSSTKCEY